MLLIFNIKIGQNPDHDRLRLLIAHAWNTIQTTELSDEFLALKCRQQLAGPEDRDVSGQLQRQVRRHDAPHHEQIRSARIENAGRKIED